MSEIGYILEKLGSSNTIPDLLSSAVRRFRNQAVIRTGVNGEIIEKTYFQLKKDVDALATAFEKKGIKDEKAAIIGSLSYEWLVAYFGIVNSGNIAVPIDKDLNAGEIEKLMQQADASLLFFDEAKAETVKEIGKWCMHINHFICFQKKIGKCNSLSGFITESNNTEKNNEQLSKLEAMEEKTAMMVFTPGVNGDNKLVMLSHKNICHNVVCSVYLIGKDTFMPEETTVHVLPLHHMFAITPGILAAILYYGITICIGGGLSDYFKSIKRFKPSVLVVVPLIVESIYKRIWREAKREGKEKHLKFLIKLNSLLLKLKIDVRRILFKKIHNSLGGNLKVIVCGGSFLDPNLVDRFQELGIILLNGYGLTECSPVVSCNQPKKIKSRSVGLVAPKPYCELKIVDGEIFIRGSIVTKGYYNDEQKTKSAFDMGWFKTGDIGYLDKDNYLYITGRKKDLIILKDGNNISPTELENPIEQHPLIKKALIYAKENNGNEILAAAVYPDYEYIFKYGITDIKAGIEDIISSLNNKMPLFKRIRMIELFEEDFDKNELRKQKRFQKLNEGIDFNENKS